MAKGDVVLKIEQQTGALFFKLPEESTEHMAAVKAGALHSVISDMDAFLRNKSKYEDKIKIDIQEVRDKLWELINGEGIDELFT